jgi:hypothetical protein
MSAGVPKEVRAYDVTGLGFRLTLVAAMALVLSSLVVLGISLHNASHSATGAPLARLDSPQLLTVAAAHGAYDPVLAVTPSGSVRALVTERGGSCVAFGTELAPTSRVALSVPATSRDGIRAAPYCTGALLPSGTLAFAAVSAGGARIVGTLDANGKVTNGTPLPGPTVVFGSMWLTGTPSGVYLVAETERSQGECCAITVWHSGDGITYGRGTTVPQPPSQANDPATFFGPVALDPGTAARGESNERLYLPFSHAGPGSSSERQLWLAGSDDGGATWSDHMVVEEPAGVTVAAQYPAAAVDAGGAVYVTWSDIGHVWYAWSKDHGQSFSGPHVVDDHTSLNVMPAVVAGDAGHIAIAWYAGTGPSVMGARSENDLWHAMLAVSGNADGPAPGIARLTLTGITAHRGSVCLLGAACPDDGDGGPHDPRLGAHLALALDPTSGGLKVAFAADSGSGSQPAVRIVQERCGERILVRPPRPLPACS